MVLDVADGGWHGDDWEGGGGESMSPVGVEEPIELVEPLHVSKPAVMQNYETLVKQHVVSYSSLVLCVCIAFACLLSQIPIVSCVISLADLLSLSFM